jgi:hypothetical protein
MAPRKRLFVVLLSLSILALTACTRDDTYLPALLDNPMADYVADGVELIAASEQGEGTDFVMDMPTHAEVVRRYRIEDQGQVEQILSDAAAFAESVGWRVQQESETEYRGAAELDVGSARIHLSTPVEDIASDPNGPRVLRISMDFGPVRFDETTVPGDGDGG